MMPNQHEMKKLMKQLNAKQIPADELVIRGKDCDYRIENPQITRMNVMGQEVLQVVGKLEEIGKESNDDYRIIMENTGCSKEQAISSLKEADGDIAEAILKIQK